MVNMLHLAELILAAANTEGFCDNCPCYSECHEGAVCKELIYNWIVEKKGK